MKKEKEHTGTKTNMFGTSKRENHDSSFFYSRKLYNIYKRNNLLEYKENIISNELIDDVHCHDSRDLSVIPDESIHLMVTSPPYNCGKEYDKDLDLNEYRQLLKHIFEQVYRKLVVGGRACIDIANLGRRPYISLHSYVIGDMLDIGYMLRGEIIWNKAAGAGVSTAWGSWMSASNPVLRDVHEYIIVFSKGDFQRPSNNRKSTISKKEFLEFTKSVWNLPTESAKRVGHPAPFPIDLPYRLIQLYTFEGDTILDPFCGSGTTCIAALQTKRHFIGFDIDQEYIKLAKKRIETFKKENRGNTK